jgi:hypothetical protein
MSNDIFLKRAREAFNSSTSFFDTNYRKKIENNLRQFQSRHPIGSKYYSDSYKYRTRGFRPKTRSFVRANEAKGVIAFFSNRDLVNVEPMNPDNPLQVASAELNKELLFHRLTHSIPWFHICMAGIQESQVTGVVCSYQHWKIKTKKEFIPILDEDGYHLYDENDKPLFRTNEIILEDKPCIELRPINNLRFSPAADWIDPINSSPYLIDLLPMYIIDVESKMNEVDDKTGASKWKKLTRAQMVTATRNNDDTTDQTRLYPSQDPTQADLANTLKDYFTVWVHRNFIKYKDTDYVFYTLGTEYLLTDPVPLEDIYWTNERPYAFGSAMIEAHKSIPDSVVHITRGLQQEANEIRNQRLDNVKFAMNARHFVRRGAEIDLPSLIRNVAGGVTLMNDPQTDVVTQKVPDVTGSSYEEQNRVDMDFDDISGAFSQASVSSNRAVGETASGMSMLRANGNELAEYLIRTISETWVERVMRQLIKLEQKYETDETILSLCSQKIKLYERFGKDIALDSVLNQELTTSVNMGIDATDPVLRNSKLTYAVGQIKSLLAEPTPGLNTEEVIKEMFANLGYKDGSRFYDAKKAGPPPEVMQLQKQMQEMSALMDSMKRELENRQAETAAKVKIAEDNRKAAFIKDELDRQDKARENELDRQAKMIEIDAKADDDFDKLLLQEKSDLIQKILTLKGDINKFKADLAGKVALETIKKENNLPDDIQVYT